VNAPQSGFHHLGGPKQEPEPVLEPLRDVVARLIARHGLGTINGERRERPNESWDYGEWERRILQCVPFMVEFHCYNLADEILSLSAQRLSNARECRADAGIIEIVRRYRVRVAKESRPRGYVVLRNGKKACDPMPHGDAADLRDKLIAADIIDFMAIAPGKRL
jgi:hypothetical protein